jgi:hypothetical protein
MNFFHHRDTESTEESLCAVPLPPGGPGGDSLQQFRSVVSVSLW